MSAASRSRQRSRLLRRGAEASAWTGHYHCGARRDSLIVSESAPIAHGRLVSQPASQAKSRGNDLSGRFGSLTIAGRAGSLQKRALYLCSCDCGRERVVRAGDLRRGRVKSCGRLHGAPLSVVVNEGQKYCPRCQSACAVSDFHGKGSSSYCKPCSTKQTAEWREQNRAGVRQQARRVALKKLAAREAHLGVAVRCHICGFKFENNCTAKISKVAHWDHDHGTGGGRGWLCASCNTGIGLLGDNPKLLETAAQYLRERGFSASKSRIA